MLADNLEKRIIELLPPDEPPTPKTANSRRASVIFSSRSSKDTVVIQTRKQWEFLETLLSQSFGDVVSFLSQMQTLTVSAFLSAEADPERDWVKSLLANCVPHLPSLKCIKLEYVDWEVPNLDSVLAACHGYKQQLTKLDITYCKFANLSQLHELVCGFTGLVDLALLGISLKDTRLSLISPSTVALQLSSLSVKWGVEVFDSLSAWLVNTGMTRSLTRLEWCPSRLTAQTNEALLRLLATVDRECLKQLSIELSGKHAIQGSSALQAPSNLQSSHSTKRTSLISTT